MSFLQGIHLNSLSGYKKLQEMVSTVYVTGQAYRVTILVYTPIKYLSFTHAVYLNFMTLCNGKILGL